MIIPATDDLPPTPHHHPHPTPSQTPSRQGLYFFAASGLLSLTATGLVKRVTHAQAPE